MSASEIAWLAVGVTVTVAVIAMIMTVSLYLIVRRLEAEESARIRRDLETWPGPE